MRIWDLAAGRSDERPVADRGSVSAVDVSPDGTRLLAAVQDGPVTLWELAGLRRTGHRLDSPPGAERWWGRPHGQAPPAGPHRSQHRLRRLPAARPAGRAWEGDSWIRK